MTGKNTELAINVGNGHTLAAFLNKGIVQAIYETHSSAVKPDDLMYILNKIVRDEITHEEILDMGGHGLLKLNSLKSMKLDNYNPFTLIGPNRSKLSELNVNLVHPIGNMMMAGPIGLLKAFEQIA